MKEYKATLCRNVVSDDSIEYLEGGHYKGHAGANVVITYNTFLNEWQDESHLKFFKSIEKAVDWYRKNFAEKILDYHRYVLGEEASEMSDEDVLNDWADSIGVALGLEA